mmetsp:Transcript_27709/g.55561  ORF Transcript_27709/g.55561 Transcript_27709/m.55561 type:complete len:80 (-) Transcript_27709:279-518(-)
MLTSTYAMHQSTNTKSNAAIDSTCQHSRLPFSNDALLLATGRSSLRQHAADTRSIFMQPSHQFKELPCYQVCVITIVES